MDHHDTINYDVKKAGGDTMARKKRYRGHYCKICGEIKSNEKFSGKGHKNHICKSCSKLSQLDKNELMHYRKIENIELSSFTLSKVNIDKLKAYSKNTKYPKVQNYAKQVLDDYSKRMDAYKEDEYGDGDEDEVCLEEDYDEYLLVESDDDIPF